MYVVATAGHVDHGKSTLLRALTGMEPDRWAVERDRGMTIDLGFVWTTLPSGAPVAFVDVPGHERFLGNMLAGVGPVPAVLFVVAADEGWMPQSAEHLAALDALGVRHGLLVLTRADLGDAALAEAEARDYLHGTSLAGIGSVAVSPVTGTGLDALRQALAGMLGGLPAPDPHAPVRLWVDRVFTVQGSGTVVTGTLGAGTIRVGDELECGSGQRVRVRDLQALRQRTGEVSGVARVAVNLRPAGGRTGLGRGVALLTPGRWRHTDRVDAWLDLAGPAAVPGSATLHIGSARVPVRLRVLGAAGGTRFAVRLSWDAAVPLRIGDRALLCDATRARGARVVGRVTVLDVSPPSLRRRGAAARRGALLAGLPAVPDARAVLAQRGLLRRTDLVEMGLAPGDTAPLVGDWLVDPDHARRLRARLVEVVAAHRAADPLALGMPVDAARQALRLPDRRLVEALVAAPLAMTNGRIDDHRADRALPPGVAAAVAQVCQELAARPFRPPEQERLAAVGLDRRALAAAEQAGALLRIADGIVLLPGADQRAARILHGLPQPFTASAAREALDTTRRVLIPLLEHLDRCGLTERLDGTRRRCLPEDRPADGGEDRDRGADQVPVGLRAGRAGR
jgi:selenocysteine-specific elongation factor